MKASLKSTTLLAITTILAGLLTSQYLPDPARASSCSKLNSVKVSSGVKYICKQVSGRLVWQAQRSATISTPRPSAKPTSPKSVKAVEWASCTRSGQTSGKGSKGLVCLRYVGSLTWISNAVLNDPYPFQPCLNPGKRVNWKLYGENIVLTCKREAEGNVWDPQVSEDQAPSTNKKIDYTLVGDYCHWNSLTPYVEQLEGSTWVKAGSARLVRKEGCPANTSGIEGKLSAEPGTKVRFSVTTERWAWLSDATELGKQSLVTVRGNPPVKLTPATSGAILIGRGPMVEFVSYTESGDESIFTFCTCNSNYSFTLTSISEVQVEGTIQNWFSYTPGQGSNLSKGGQEFRISLRKSTFKWDLANLQFKIAGIPIGVTGELPFSQTVLVSFTWR